LQGDEIAKLYDVSVEIQSYGGTCCLHLLPEGGKINNADRY